jgi:starch synthase
MEKKRLLVITQEMEPYTEGSEISAMVGLLPKFLQDSGYDLRILMPRYGVVNERRHRLHEVVRLSGMNIIVDDDDYPLIIKVASLPGSRLQVYFLDNEDFFRRKFVFNDADGVPFEDNAERAAFFCKGAIETVKKFGWAPDVVLCMGWMTSLLPLYLRTAYKTEPIFMHAQVVYGAFDAGHTPTGAAHFFRKASINHVSQSDLDIYVENDQVVMHQGASHYSDGIIVGSSSLNSLVEGLSVQDKAVLFRQPESDFAGDCATFLGRMLEASVPHS